MRFRISYTYGTPPFFLNIPNNTKPGEHSTEVLWFFRRLHIAHSVRILNKQANIAYTSIGVMYRLLGGSHWRHNLGVWRCTRDINRFCWFCRRTWSQTRRLNLQHTPIIGTWSVCVCKLTRSTYVYTICYLLERTHRFGCCMV
jgi:hypothetical protein